VDRADAQQVGLASKETSAPRLGKEVAQGEPKARTNRTTKDGSRETPSSPRGHSTNGTGAQTP
jgi:hypothetical protein